MKKSKPKSVVILSPPPECLRLTGRQKRAMDSLFAWEKASNEKHFMLGEPS